MPIYSYECDECGVRFDARQKFSDDPISVCPECGGYTHRVPQPVGIVFKGKGWYVTDSKGRNNLAVPPKKDTDSGDSAANGKSDAGESTSVTDAKTEPAPKEQD
jgi:putative FmdB family regulatory protein